MARPADAYAQRDLPATPPSVFHVHYSPYTETKFMPVNSSAKHPGT